MIDTTLAIKTKFLKQPLTKKQTIMVNLKVQGGIIIECVGN
jgi:hypothetical protein